MQEQEKHININTNEIANLKSKLNELENNYQLSFLASYNANGLFNSKKFKIVEPFGSKAKPKKTIKDREATLEFLKSKF